MDTITAPTIEELMERARQRDRVQCPHCGHVVDTSDPDFLTAHVTYWGSENGAAAETCQNCGVTFYLEERVSRHWVAGRTPKEASE